MDGFSRELLKSRIRFWELDTDSTLMDFDQYLDSFFAERRTKVEEDKNKLETDFKEHSDSRIDDEDFDFDSDCDMAERFRQDADLDGLNEHYAELQGENEVLENCNVLRFELMILAHHKMIEQNIKNLIKDSYPTDDEKKLFKFERLKDFLKSKNILIGGFAEYQSFYELQELANAIKHVGVISKSLGAIPGWSSGAEFTSESLKSAVDRLYPSVEKFFRNLCEEIYKDLFEFPGERLQEMAETIRHTLDPSDVEKLCALLKCGTRPD